MQKTAGIWQDTAIPAPYLLQHPGKMERLKDLPESELRAWYENMEEGRKMGHTDLIIELKSSKFKEGRNSIMVTPMRLYLPDGSFRLLGESGLIMEEDLILKDPREYLKAKLHSEAKNADTLQADVGMTTSQYMSKAVDWILDSITKTGVERQGYFEELHDRLMHMTGEASGVKITVGLDKYHKNQAGDLQWAYGMQVITKAKNGKVYAIYHTHQHPEDIHPSQPDIQEMIKQKRTSIIIATRDTNDDGPAPYTLTEWRPKAGVDVKAELERQLDKNPNLKDNMPQELIETLFDKKQYTLREENERITLKPKDQ